MKIPKKPQDSRDRRYIQRVLYMGRMISYIFKYLTYSNNLFIDMIYLLLLFFGMRRPVINDLGYWKHVLFVSFFYYYYYFVCGHIFKFCLHGWDSGRGWVNTGLAFGGRLSIGWMLIQIWVSSSSFIAFLVIFFYFINKIDWINWFWIGC